MGDQRSDQPASQPPPTHRTTATHTHPEPASPPAPVNPNLLQTATKQKQEIGSNLKENLPQTATSMQRNSWPRPQPRPQPRPGPKPRPASVKPWPRPGPKPRPASVKPWLLFPRTYVITAFSFMPAVLGDDIQGGVWRGSNGNTSVGSAISPGRPTLSGAKLGHMSHIGSRTYDVHKI